MHILSYAAHQSFPPFVMSELDLNPGLEQVPEEKDYLHSPKDNHVFGGTILETCQLLQEFNVDTPIGNSPEGLKEIAAVLSSEMIDGDQHLDIIAHQGDMIVAEIIKEYQNYANQLESGLNNFSEGKDDFVGDVIDIYQELILYHEYVWNVYLLFKQYHTLFRQTTERALDKSASDNLTTPVFTPSQAFEAIVSTVSSCDAENHEVKLMRILRILTIIHERMGNVMTALGIFKFNDRCGNIPDMIKKYLEPCVTSMHQYLEAISNACTFADVASNVRVSMSEITDSKNE